MYVSEKNNAINVFKKHGGILRTSEALAEGIYRQSVLLSLLTGASKTNA
ncbi:hypothetical protein Asal01_02655 [Fodinibius salicampi]